MNHTFANKSSTILLRRAQLLPGKSLPSLLERLVQLNYYPSLRTLIQLGCEPLTAGSLACPQSVGTFLWLSGLTGIHPKDLYAASNHSLGLDLRSRRPLPKKFSWAHANSEIKLPKNRAYDVFRFVTGAQYCPNCLRTRDYHRLIWSLIPATICLEHKCLLVNQCPKCHKQLSVKEIVRKCCQACQTDLSAVKSRSVADDQLGLRSQQLIQSWFIGIFEPVYGSGLPSVRPAELYRLLQSLLGCLMTRQKDWGMLSAPLNGLPKQGILPMHKWLRLRQQLLSLNSEEVFHLYRAAFSGIFNWPEGIFDFWDAYSGHEAKQSLRSLQISWNGTFWKNPEFELAHSDFIDYLIARKIPFPAALAEKFRNEKWFVEKTGLCSIEYASTVSNIAVRDLNQLLQHGLLRLCTWEYARRNIPILEIEKLLRLKQQWAVGWSVEEARTWLGVSEQTMDQLIKLGLVAVVQKTKGGKSKQLLSCQSAKDFFEKITSQLKLFEGNPRDTISLRDAAEYFGCIEKYRSVLLQLVVNGILPAYKREQEIQRLDRVYFSWTSMLDIRELVCGRRDFISEDAFILDTGTSKRLFRKWIKSALVKSKMKVGPDNYFKRSDLEKLANEHTSD